MMEDRRLASYGRTVALVARLVETAVGDLSLTAYRVLALVAQGDERSSQIAGRLAVGKPRVTYAVDSLVAQGLLTRSGVEGDRRVVRLELTAAGRDALAAADKAAAARLRPIFEHLDNPDAALAGMEAVQQAITARSVERARQRVKQ